MEKGYLALVYMLICPTYVTQSTKISLKRIVYEAITETYIPLLNVFEGLL